MMMLSITYLQNDLAALAFFQGTQLDLFERFLTQAISGINSTSITAGMQNAAYVVLLIGFLWQVYQSALHGGDVRGLGTSLIKYVVTALIVMNYSVVFTTINQGFVNAGNWISNASGGNVFENWMSDLQNQFSQDASQQLWGLVTGSLAGLIDGLLILVGVHSLPFCRRDLWILLHLLRQHPLYLRSPRDCAYAAWGDQPACQSVCRKHLHMEFVADLVRWLRCSADCSADGASWADAQPEQLSRRIGESRGFLPHWYREHYLLPGNCDHSFHCQANRQWGCWQYRCGHGRCRSHGPYCRRGGS